MKNAIAKYINPTPPLNLIHARVPTGYYVLKN